MDNIETAIMHLAHNMREQEQRNTISFKEFLDILVADPRSILRNVFQIFHDMVRTYVSEGVDEYPEDPENIQDFQSFLDRIEYINIRMSWTCKQRLKSTKAFLESTLKIIFSQWSCIILRVSLSPPG